MKQEVRLDAAERVMRGECRAWNNPTQDISCRGRGERRLAVILPAALLFAAALHGQAAVVYVNAAQTNNVPDGASWPTAFVTVQEAISAASYGDAVWVAAGTYFENLTLSNGVALYGGFNGTETDLSQRNWNTNFTILDGRQSNSVVIVAAGATNTTRIDGFTIRNGSASFGGGVYCANASPLLFNNRILYNFATNNGGGIYCFSGSPVMASNLIQGNTVKSGGGRGGAGIGCVSSAPKIFSNRIIANSHLSIVYQSAGGVSCDGGQSPEISNNVLIGNTAVRSTGVYGSAGGILVKRAGSPRLINNTIAWCQSDRYAGGIFCDTNSAVIANNIVAFCSGGIIGVDGMTFKNNCVFGNGQNYTAFPDPTGSNGNISVDPQLATNIFFPDAHILSSSPCRDAGDPILAADISLDIDGDARVIGAAVDIGADEFNGATPESPPLIVRVTAAGDDRNDGSSWAKSKRTLQSAIDAATLKGGEVWVAAGTYVENLTLRHFVFLYGGFAGSETNRTQRDWTTNVTILDGNQSGSVITANDLQSWNVIDGFVIRNGKANAGAGIYCNESSPTIAHNFITENVTTNYTGQGGGLYCVSYSPYGLTSAIISNIFTLNRAAVGGGVCCEGISSQPVIRNNRLEANTAAVIASIPFTSASGGGGIYVYRTAEPRIENNYLLNNVATNAGDPGVGGGICVDGANGQIINNTLVGNVASSGKAGGIHGGLVVANNIVAFGSSGIRSTYSTSPKNNCVFGNTVNYPGTDLTGTNGNISVDPLLLATNNYHLSSNSPCINAGNNTFVSSPVDFDGNPRIAGGTVDIGAHEFPSPTSVLSYAWLQQYGLPTDGSADYADTDGDGASNWLEWLGGSNPTNALSVPAPLITNQPTSLSSVRGINASFAVSLISIPPPGYQWQFNGTNVPGATLPSYTVTNVQPANVGAYRVIVTNTYGATVSSNALLALGDVAGWEGNSGAAAVPLGTTGTVAVAGGYSFSVRLNTNGTLNGWGQNEYGQLTFPAYLSDVVAVAAGYATTLALRADGSVVGFGSPPDITSVPAGVTNVVAIAIGETHAMALKADGKVVAWGGYNNYGETTVPADLSNVVAISCGWIHSLALKDDGTVVGWGNNLFDQTNVPSGLSDVVSIAAGALHSIALKSDGTVVAWGKATAATNVPTGLDHVVAISSAADNCLALRDDGTVVAWGRNESGQTNVPTGLTNVVSVASGWYHSLAVVGDGPPLPRAPISKPRLSNGRFTVSLPTQSGRVYRLEYKNSFSETNWTPLSLVAGNGHDITLIDPSATDSQRFYRVRRW